MLTAFSALRAGEVFSVDTISVIASCQEEADIIADALKILKIHSVPDRQKSAENRPSAVQ